MKANKTSLELLERAMAYQRAGRSREAESLCRKVISRSPNYPPALFTLSVSLFEAGRFEEASRYLERAVGLCPSDPVYLINLGEAYRRLGDLERAALAFERVLSEDPDFPEAHQNLGITFMEQGAPDIALPHLERAVALRPNNARFRVSLAWALLKLGRAVESTEHGRRAIELEPQLAPAHRQLGSSLDEIGERSAAIASYRRAIELDPSDYNAHSNLILVTLTDPSYDAAGLLAEARAWSKLHADPLRERWRPHENSKDPERRLRVGYVSPDLRAHPVQQFLMPLLQRHDASAVEVYLYSSVEKPDRVTEQYRALAGERFRDIRRMPDAEAAELVRRDQIDVLVDLALHSAGGRLRLFACKPAPVQITWLGYAGTTGLDSIDYRITDPFIDPPGTDLSVYSEASLELPQTSWCYAALEPDLHVGPLPALSNGVITFGSQNSYRKVNPQVLSLWASVLRELPGSRLLLHAGRDGQGSMLAALDAAGIAAERVEIVGRVSRREYLERYHRIDIALDTFPFSGATTSLDAAWMGVPVITLTGRTSLQRASTCVAMNLGLPELVASTEAEFVEKAVELANDWERLGQLRAGLRGRLESSPLGDAVTFARHLEGAYRSAWRRYNAAG